MPAVVMGWLVVRHWVPLPFWDEWVTGAMLVSWFDGTLTLRELPAQFNESRALVGRLLQLLLIQFGPWDPRKDMALLFVTVCAITLFFFFMMRRTEHVSGRGAAVAWVGASFLCFSPVQVDNFIYGALVSSFLSSLALVAAGFVNVSRLSFSTRCVANALLALVITYTFANGMLLWVLGLPLLPPNKSLSRRRMVLGYGSYAFVATAAVAMYFTGYEKPGHHPEVSAGIKNLGNIAHYLVLWIGSYFDAPGVSPLAAGLTASGIFGATIVAVVTAMTRTGEWRPFYPGLLLSGYACGTALMIAVGRVGFGVEQALEIRYRAFSVFFYLAILALLVPLYAMRSRWIGGRARIAFVGSCAAIALVALVGWGACYPEGYRYMKLVHSRNLMLLRALEWIEVIPDNPDLAYLYPSADHVLRTSRALRQHNALRVNFAKPAVARNVRKPPPETMDESAGRLETCMIDSNRNLYVTGWAKLPFHGSRANCVVLAAEQRSGEFKPVSVMEAAPVKSKPVGEGKVRRVWFSRSLNTANLPAGDVLLGAWAVDLKKKKVYPLAGARWITADQR